MRDTSQKATGEPIHLETSMGTLLFRLLNGKEYRYWVDASVEQEFRRRWYLSKWKAFNYVKDNCRKWAIEEPFYSPPPRRNPRMSYDEARATFGRLGADLDSDLKKEYRRLSLKFHPDRGGDESKFKALSEAYDVLSKAGSRTSTHARPHYGPSVDEQARAEAMYEEIRRKQRARCNAGHHTFDGYRCINCGGTIKTRATISGYVLKDGRLGDWKSKPNCEDSVGTKYLTGRYEVVREFREPEYGEKRQALIFAILHSDPPVAEDTWIAGYYLADGGDLFRGKVVYGGKDAARAVALSEAESWFDVDRVAHEHDARHHAFMEAKCSVCDEDAKTRPCDECDEEWYFPCGHDQD